MSNQPNKDHRARSKSHAKSYGDEWNDLDRLIEKLAKYQVPFSPSHFLVDHWIGSIVVVIGFFCLSPLLELPNIQNPKRLFWVWAGLSILITVALYVAFSWIIWKMEKDLLVGRIEQINALEANARMLPSTTPSATQQTTIQIAPIVREPTKRFSIAAPKKLSIIFVGSNMFWYSLDQDGNSGPRKLPGGLTVRAFEGQLYFSCTVTNGQSNATLTDNEISDNPGGWDINQNGVWAEVVDGNQRPIFQILIPPTESTTAFISGIFRISDKISACTFSQGTMIWTDANSISEYLPQLRVVFKYPAAQFVGVGLKYDTVWVNQSVPVPNPTPAQKWDSSAPRDANGFVDFRANEPRVYVSNSGNDANPGTENSPLATWNRAQKLISNSAGATVYFHRGDIFDVDLISLSGKDESDVLLLSSYGDYARGQAKLTNIKSDVIAVGSRGNKPQRYVVFDSLAFIPSKDTLHSQLRIALANTEFLYFSDCTMLATPISGAAIIEVPDDGSVNHLVFHRCRFANKLLVDNPKSVYSGGIQDLIIRSCVWLLDHSPEAQTQPANP